MTQRLESIPLGEVATIFNGKTPARSEQRNQGHPVLKIRDIDEWSNFVGEFASFVEPELAQNFPQKHVKQNDILILNAAHNADYVGSKVYFASSEVGGALATGEWTILRADSRKLDSHYLYYWITSSFSRKALRDIVKGIHLYPKDVQRLEIPLPPLEQQRRIAAILDKADELRGKRRQAIEKLEKLLQSVFLEVFGDPVTNPKSWDECHLGEVANITSGVAKGRKFGNKNTVEVPYMRVANVQDEHIVLNDVKTIEVLPEEVQKYALLTGDILLTEGGDPDKLGRGAIWQGEIEPCIHQNHIFRVRVKNDNLLPEFISPLIGSQRGKRYFLSAAKQTTGIATINMSQLKRFPLLLPPIELQKKYFDLSKSIENKLLVFEKSLGELNTLFHSLQHRAFRGEL
jgi:type I restriction enzyme, S subunit